MIWCVGQVRGEPGGPIEGQWEFQGVFDSEDKAVAACRGWNWFVFPVELNQSLPDETIGIAGEYFPEARRAGAISEQPKPGDPLAIIDPKWREKAGAYKTSNYPQGGDPC